MQMIQARTGAAARDSIKALDWWAAAEVQSRSGLWSNPTLGLDTNTNSSLMVDGHAQVHPKSRPTSGRGSASLVPGRGTNPGMSRDGRGDQAEAD